MSQQENITLFDFQARFSNEEACQEHLFNITGTFHGLDRKHLQVYLDEFCYRFNRRKWHSQLFNRLLHACVNGPIVTYAEVTL